MPAAPAIQEIALRPNRTSIAVQVALQNTTSAFVYCAALPAAVQLVSTSQVLAQNTFAFTATGHASVVLSGLQPATSYRVYCATKGLQYNVLSLSEVLRMARPTSTLCCKALTVSLLRSSVTVDALTPSTIAVAVDSAPSSRVVLQLQLQSSSGAITPTGSVFPGSYTLFNTSSLAAAALAVSTGSTTGTLLLVASLSGPSANEYSVAYVGGRSLLVTGKQVEPPTPALLGAAFSDTGDRVRLSFSAPTNKAAFNSNFRCDTLLQFAGSSQARCVWADATNIDVYPVYVRNSTLVVGSAVTYLGNTTRAQCASTLAFCSQWRYITQSTVRVAAPASPVRPQVQMSMPTAVSGCAGLSIDVSSSIGAGGRPWTTPTQIAVQASPGSNQAAMRLEQFLQRNHSLIRSTVVPASILERGNAYTVQWTLCNFLGACGSATGTVSVLQAVDQVPTVTILGAAARTVKRSDSISLSAQAFTVTCEGAQSFANLDLQWSIRPADSSVELGTAEYRSVSQSPAVFKLRPYVLSVHQQYLVRLTVRSLLSGRSTATSVYVTVAPSVVVAEITGSANRAVKAGETITLDASKSYDDDVQGKTGLAAGLRFLWSCVQTEPSFNVSCPLLLSAPSLLGQITAVEKLNVTATRVNTTALLTVTVYDATTRSSTATVEVRATNAKLPVLEISTSSSALRNVNTAKDLVLLGSLQLFAPCTAVWQVDDADLRLQSIASTAVASPLTPPLQSRLVPFNLVVTRNTLPQRAQLTFSLSCGGSRTAVTVTTNGAPIPGQFSVSPSTGYELSTVFEFLAPQWSDADTPLTYQFGFQSVTSLANLVIISRSEVSFASSTLPAGGDDRGFGLNCTLQVFDSLGASVSVLTQVASRPLDAAQLFTSLQKLISSNPGSVDGTKTVLSVASAVLNSVNCSAAPNCTQVHRRACTRTSGECGACLDGFVGDIGDGNSLCIPVGESLQALPQICQRDIDCTYSWQRCDVGSRTCVAPPKACANNCSSHGQCIFQNRLTGKLLHSCRLTDSHCDAHCACVDSYSGVSCEIAIDKLKQHRAIRSSLISGLQNLTSVEDINSESVTSWSAGLYSLVLNPFELSVTDAARVADVANATIYNALTLGQDSPEALLGVLQTADAVASVRQYNYDPNDYDLQASTTARAYPNNTAGDTLRVVGLFGDLALQSLVLGQNASTYMYDNFRLSTMRHDMQSNVTVAAPQSDAELQAGATASIATLVPSSTEAAGSIATKAVVVFPRAVAPDTTLFLSNPQYLQIVSADSSAEASQFLSSVEFTFQHNAEERDFYHAAPTNFTSRCLSSVDVRPVHTFHCPGSGEVLHHNCSRGTGLYTSLCPVRQPSCSKLNIATAELSAYAGCRLVSFNVSHTTCACAVSSSGGDVPTLRRRTTTEQSLLDDSGAASVIATSTYIATDFAYTFTAADDLTSASALRRVFIVIVVISSLWACGLLLLLVDYLKPQLSKKAPELKPADAAAEARSHVLRYIETTIPAVFSQETPFLRRVLAELQRHHISFQLFAAKTEKKRREIVFKLLTTFTFMIFLVCVFYDAGSPDDDGSCADHTAREDCLQRRSPFDSSMTYCRWDAQPSLDEPPCAFNTQELSTTAMLYLSFLITTLTAVMTVPNDFLLGILNAPTVESLQATRAQQMGLMVVAAGMRRMSNTALAVGSAMRRASASAISVVPGTMPVDRDPSQSRQRSHTLLSRVSAIIRPPGAEVQANRAIPDDVLDGRNLAGRALADIAANSQALRAESVRHATLLKAHSSRLSTQYTSPSSKRLDVDSRSVSADSGSELRPASPAGSVGVALAAAESLFEDVLLQRCLLADSSSLTAEFEQHWGLGMHGDTFEIHQASKLAIAQDVLYTDNAAADLKETVTKYTAEHAGVEIMHLFMVDLLGRETAAAKIFREKFAEDFEDTQAVTLVGKVLAGSLLGALNLFFVFYLVLKGYQKGPEWQLQFFLSCVAQILVELMVFETTECLWLNYSIPSFVHAEVATAMAVLRGLVERLSVPPALRTSRSSFFLDAPPHLFVSLKLARDFPQLLESAIVCSYSSHLPGRLWETWPHFHARAPTAADSDSNNSAVLRLVVLPAIALSTWLTQTVITIPFLYQRIVIRFAQPLLFSGVTLLWYLATSSVTALVFLSVFSAAILALLLRWHMRMYKKRGRDVAKIVPDISAVEEEDAVLPGAHMGGCGAGDGCYEEPAVDLGQLHQPSASFLLSQQRSSEDSDSDDSDRWALSAMSVPSLLEESRSGDQPSCSSDGAQDWQEQLSSEEESLALGVEVQQEHRGSSVCDSACSVDLSLDQSGSDDMSSIVLSSEDPYNSEEEQSVHSGSGPAMSQLVCHSDGQGEGSDGDRRSSEEGRALREVEEEDRGENSLGDADDCSGSVHAATAEVRPGEGAQFSSDDSTAASSMV